MVEGYAHVLAPLLFFSVFFSICHACTTRCLGGAQWLLCPFVGFFTPMFSLMGLICLLSYVLSILRRGGWGLHDLRDVFCGFEGNVNFERGQFDACKDYDEGLQYVFRGGYTSTKTEMDGYRAREEAVCIDRCCVRVL